MALAHKYSVVHSHQQGMYELAAKAIWDVLSDPSTGVFELMPEGDEEDDVGGEGGDPSISEATHPTVSMMEEEEEEKEGEERMAPSSGGESSTKGWLWADLYYQILAKVYTASKDLKGMQSMLVHCRRHPTPHLQSTLGELFSIGG